MIETIDVSKEDFENLAKDFTNVDYLSVFEKDPYWPKWNNLWWKALVMYETDNFDLVPEMFIKYFYEVINKHYLHFFPFTLEEIPENANPYRNIICHCAMGAIIKFGVKKNIDIINNYPWIYEWIFKYQLPDGGYNCDEQAYTNSKKSSILSTISMAEAVLELCKKTDNKKLTVVLEKCFDYFIKHRIFRSSKGDIIYPGWKDLTFPRFYEFDLLRGLNFIEEAALLLKKEIPYESIEETVELLKFKQNDNGMFKTERIFHLEEGTLALENGKWEFKKEVSTFPVLDKLLKRNAVNPFLKHFKNRG